MSCSHKPVRHSWQALSVGERSLLDVAEEVIALLVLHAAHKRLRAIAGWCCGDDALRSPRSVDQVTSAARVQGPFRSWHSPVWVLET
eukprot:8326262-Alexandrium_andersonii.AAC.1